MYCAHVKDVLLKLFKGLLADGIFLILPLQIFGHLLLVRIDAGWIKLDMNFLWQEHDLFILLRYSRSVLENIMPAPANPDNL